MGTFSQALEKLSAGSAPTAMPVPQPQASIDHLAEDAETIDELDNFSAHTAPAIDPAPQKGKSKWMYVGIGVAAVALIGAGIVFGLQRNDQAPSAAAEPAVVAQATSEPEDATKDAGQPASPTKKPATPHQPRQNSPSRIFPCTMTLRTALATNGMLQTGLT